MSNTSSSITDWLVEQLKQYTFSKLEIVLMTILAGSIFGNVQMYNDLVAPPVGGVVDPAPPQQSTLPVQPTNQPAPTQGPQLVTETVYTQDFELFEFATVDYHPNLGQIAPQQNDPGQVLPVGVEAWYEAIPYYHSDTPGFFACDADRWQQFGASGCAGGFESEFNARPEYRTACLASDDPRGYCSGQSTEDRRVHSGSYAGQYFWSDRVGYGGYWMETNIPQGGQCTLSAYFQASISPEFDDGDDVPLSVMPYLGVYTGQPLRPGAGTIEEQLFINRAEDGNLWYEQYRRLSLDFEASGDVVIVLGGRVNYANANLFWDDVQVDCTYEVQPEATQAPTSAPSPTPTQTPMQPTETPESEPQRPDEQEFPPTPTRRATEQPDENGIIELPPLSSGVPDVGEAVSAVDCSEPGQPGADVRDNNWIAQALPTNQFNLTVRSSPEIPSGNAASNVLIEEGTIPPGADGFAVLCLFTANASERWAFVEGIFSTNANSRFITGWVNEVITIDGDEQRSLLIYVP